MSPPPVDAGRGGQLVALARRALTSYFHLDETFPPPGQFEPAGPVGGLFVTLEREGALRGCIGFLSPDADLPTLVERAVVASAVEDPRFARVEAHELPYLRIIISVLSPPVPLESFEEIEIGRHGLIVERDGARGLLLPRVALERTWSSERFLAETCRKAGLGGEAFRDPRTRVLRFEAVEFSERIP